jgi:tetratricopeptide (TPR) repeat protein
MSDERMDRFACGELTPSEARALAQQSLDDPDLFEELTATALARKAVSIRRDSLGRRNRIVVFGAIAAALIVAIAVYSLRLSRREPLKPALAFAASADQPLLLVLAPAAGQNQREIFRSVEQENRAPRAAGSVVSQQGGSATIDLGSLDGLEKGAELEVVRQDRSMGRLTVTTVFRERNRSNVLSGTVQKNDSVRVAPATHLNALLRYSEASGSRGDSVTARSTAEQAVEWSRSNQLRAEDALAWLGGLEMQAGMFQAAEEHCRAAGSNPEALNILASLDGLRGDYVAAKATLTEAISKLPKSGSGYGRVANNLGVLAELRGDRAEAEKWYSEALAALSSDQRHAVETNLSRVRGSR